VVPQQAEPPLRRVVFETMKPGEVTGPHATNHGLIFVRLNSRKEGALRPFEEVREQLIDEIRTEVAKQTRQEAYAKVADKPVELVGPYAEKAEKAAQAAASKPAIAVTTGAPTAGRPATPEGKR